MMGLSGFAEVLVPRVCVGCGFLGSYLCPCCAESLVSFPPSCFYCGRPACAGATCFGCLRGGGVDGCVSAFTYTKSAAKLIRLKYQRSHAPLRELLSVLPGRALAPLSFWVKALRPVAVPVPCSANSIFDRGFSPPLLVAHHIAALFGLGVAPCLSRVKAGPPQAGLKNKQARRDNVKGVFAVDNRATPRTILLVDDVITSGATVAEAVRTLKKNPATEKVVVFSVASAHI